MSEERIDSIVKLITDEAKERKLPTDYVSRLYQVEVEVLGRVNKIMKQQRQEERDELYRKQEVEDEESRQAQQGKEEVL